MLNVASKTPAVTPAGKPANDGVVVATGPFVSEVFTSPGPLITWIWETVTGERRSAKVTCTRIRSVTSSIVTIANPVPGESVGGASFGPERTAVKVIGAACTGIAATSNAKASRTMRVICPPINVNAHADRVRIPTLGRARVRGAASTSGTKLDLGNV